MTMVTWSWVPRVLGMSREEGSRWWEWKAEFLFLVQWGPFSNGALSPGPGPSAGALSPGLGPEEQDGTPKQTQAELF